MFELKTLNDVMSKVTAGGDRQVMLWQDPTGAWKPITADALYGRIRALAAVLQGWGVAKGDRVALLSENRWEWAVTDFACFAIGAVDVPLYGTLTPEELGYSLRDSGAKVAVFSTREQYEKVTKAGELPDLQHVVVMDDGEYAGAETFSKLLKDAPGMQGRDETFDRTAASVEPDDLATIIYTSGTTGQPKGVKITHGNLAANLNRSTDDFDFKDTDSLISFLPLSHVTARHVDYVMMIYGARLAYCPKFNEIAPAMKAVKPTIFIGVPRVYEKIRQAVEGKSAGSAVKNAIMKWALKTGAGHRDEVLAGKTPGGLAEGIAQKLVFSKIREAFGGCVHTFVSGGAPLGNETLNWYADVGIRVYEGYGLTETSPVIGLNSPKNFKPGSIGRPLPNLETRFAADGELEVKGPSVFHGYWNKDKETAEAFTEDGFFKTGDIGNGDDGFITITDRKKELLKTSGGKMIAPQPLENKLKANTLVEQAALVGDKHKFLCVLISPNFPALEDWAKSNGIAAGDHGKLVADQKVVAEYQRIVDGVNKELPPYETMKRIKVVPDGWTVESGEMTPSHKLKRRVIEKKYENEIKEFYADEATSAKA
jgi:long-chain acyl-CoA synthetase